MPDELWNNIMKINNLFRREQNINFWGCLNFGYIGLWGGGGGGGLGASGEYPGGGGGGGLAEKIQI